MPTQPVKQGLVVDPRAGRKGLNDIIRVTDGQGGGIWLKTEENPYAAKAEMACSALLSQLQWPGVSNRSHGNESDSVLAISELGVGDIQDMGGFNMHFQHFRDEDATSLLVPRPGVLKRIPLAILSLDPPTV